MVVEADDPSRNSSDKAKLSSVALLSTSLGMPRDRPMHQGDKWRWETQWSMPNSESLPQLGGQADLQWC